MEKNIELWKKIDYIKEVFNYSLIAIRKFLSTRTHAHFLFYFLFSEIQKRFPCIWENIDESLYGKIICSMKNILIFDHGKKYI